MTAWICVTCGTQVAPTDHPPAVCPICQDQRQHVGCEGQQWTTLDQMASGGFRNDIAEQEAGLIEIHTTPTFAIGQRALVLRTSAGNVLWDCVSFLDEATIDAVRHGGGIQVIAISHPHYYTTMVEWAERFDARIVLHAADRRWVMRGSDRVTFWDGDAHALMDGVTLVRAGGHFPGGTILHWRDGADGRGALLTGDIVDVVADRRWVSFMYSYPNLIPLPAAEVRRIGEAVGRYRFDRIYGAWVGSTVARDARGAVARSVERYITALDTGLSDADGSVAHPPARGAGEAGTGLDRAQDRGGGAA